MKESSNTLFNTDDNDVVMPSGDRIEDTKGIMSTDISPALLGEKISRIVVPVDKEIEYPNYIIDFTDVKSISYFQKEALRSLCTEFGDCSIYLYLANKLEKIGNGEADSLEILLPIIKNDCFDSKIKIYRNFKLGDEEVDEIKGIDVTKLSLNI